MTCGRTLGLEWIAVFQYVYHIHMHQIKIQRRFASNLYIVSSARIGLTVIAGKCNASWDIVVIEYYIQKQTLFVVLYAATHKRKILQPLLRPRMHRRNQEVSLSEHEIQSSDSDGPVRL